MIILTTAATDVEQRKSQIKAWRAALVKANKLAAQNPKNLPKYYQISYRIGKSDAKTKFPPNDRRSALVELIDALAPAEMHLSTSCWLVMVHIQKAENLLKLLSPPLLPEFDFLGVTQVSKSNRFEFGCAHLESSSTPKE